MTYFSKSDLKGSEEREKMIRDFPTKRAIAIAKNKKSKAIKNKWRALANANKGGLGHKYYAFKKKLSE